MTEKKIYKRRWRGFTEKEVSERMAMIAKNRFKDKQEATTHVRVMVEARGSWQLVNGKKTYVRKTKFDASNGNESTPTPSARKDQ